MGIEFGLLLGLGVGYVLGTCAGREQYERIRLAVSKVRRPPVVTRFLDSVGEEVSNMVRIQGKRVTDKVVDVVKERLLGALATPCEVDLRFGDEGPNSR